jgi:hypothetical protein
MNEFKRSFLLALQVLVGASTAAATAVALAHPECVPGLLAEVARGVSACLLFAGVKVLVKVSGSRMSSKPVWCWWCYGWAVVRHELRCGLVSGYLLGLVLAVRECFGR